MDCRGCWLCLNALHRSPEFLPLYSMIQTTFPQMMAYIVDLGEHTANLGVLETLAW